ncbi:peroxiredoxin-like family protein [Robertkochia flava]|uniref:peroxiredoxin-like family protein n=1 Tax=Robertkochia flava TaxID=3447986 RepID=UPI001CCF1586|nr:peroxiredoxin-like family protein [Robertkochia marina]
MSLTEKLNALNQANRNKIPEEALSVMDQATLILKEKAITDTILKTGASFPDATLTDPHHQPVSLRKEIEGTKTIISFYRGGWCPYCNLELRSMQEELENFKALGAQLIAISPETPDNSLSTTEKNNLNFKVFSDKDHELAKKAGLVFQVPESLKEVYSTFGIDLETSQGNSDWNLPVPATFILDETGIVRYVYANEDYTKRAEPKALEDALKVL